MKFVADESVDNPIVDVLRTGNYDVVYIKEILPGIDDEAVLKLASDSGSILITMDKDFGELVYRDGHRHAGVVLIRLEGYTPTQRAELVVAIFDKYNNELGGAFTVVQPRFTRIRPFF